MIKKFLLYVLLPGIVLGTVYSAGKDAGRSETLKPSDFPVTEVDIPQSAAATTAVPDAIAKPHSQKPKVAAKSPPIAKPSSKPVVQTPQIERYQVRQTPRVIETPHAAPERSIYDRREPSELGLMPLRPLYPPAALERAPAPQQPMLAPPVGQRARVYPTADRQPAEPSAAVDCGCGD